MKDKKIHPIRYVANQTGLTPHLIRAWERRYGAIKPKRTPSNQRLYSEADIERLRLLREATLTGHRIGQLADFTTDALSKLVSAGEKTPLSYPPIPYSEPSESSPLSTIEASLSAIMSLDFRALDMTLTRAAVSLTGLSLIERVIVPLINKIGELWSEGSLKIYKEHMATSIIKSFLGDMLRSSEPPTHAPKIIITTPAGQVHELGAMILANLAAYEGWHSLYLGPNLPAEEIAAAAEQSGARVVALSIVHPAGDPRLIRELRKLRRLLDDKISIIVGGQAADAYDQTLEAIGATRMHDLKLLPRQLKNLLAGKPGA